MPSHLPSGNTLETGKWYRGEGCHGREPLEAFEPMVAHGSSFSAGFSNKWSRAVVAVSTKNSGSYLVPQQL